MRGPFIYYNIRLKKKKTFPANIFKIKNTVKWLEIPCIKPLLVILPILNPIYSENVKYVFYAWMVYLSIKLSDKKLFWKTYLKLNKLQNGWKFLIWNQYWLYCSCWPYWNPILCQYCNHGKYLQWNTNIG